MIARLIRNPAAVLLCVIVLVAVMATVWAVVVVVEDTGDVWLNPEPSEAAIAQYRVVQFAAAIPAPATLVGVLALLGVLFVGAVTSRVVDADRVGPVSAADRAGRSSSADVLERS